jgi:hypothetical protein
VREPQCLRIPAAIKCKAGRLTWNPPKDHYAYARATGKRKFTSRLVGYFPGRVPMKVPQPPKLAGRVLPLARGLSPSLWYKQEYKQGGRRAVPRHPVTSAFVVPAYVYADA